MVQVSRRLHEANRRLTIPLCERSQTVVSGQHAARFKEQLFDCKGTACAVCIGVVNAAEPEQNRLLFAGQLA